MKPIKNDDGTYSLEGEYEKRTFIEFLLKKPKRLRKVSAQFVISAIMTKKLSDNLSFVKNSRCGEKA